MDLKTIASHYTLGEILNCTSMQQGTSSAAMLLETTLDRFVLRQLRDEGQALAEYEVYEALAPANISPSILCTKEGLPYITLGHMIYNVQTYIEKVVPQHSLSLNYVELGKVIARFHQRILQLDMTRLGQKDRFALPSLWEAVSGDILNSSSEVIRRLASHVEECCKYQSKHTAVIHGDLGLWNVLFTESHMYIIDVGEVRCGNHHFDLAAILSSTCSSSTTVCELEERMIQLERGYRSEGRDVNREILYEQIHLWVIRGLLAIIREKGIIAPTIPYIERNLAFLGKCQTVMS
ncbi:hypothetical protein ASD24_21310 [Paenibacillus sp. Root52]|uniref:phosphotransferase n=1 Tax=Paenibacillus sp. Root52 TaxID=1736552 RepID=UPI0006F878CA|nr:phosphotransferase [Paenibacillus sp. Root52]KQY92933.1 hypothetical protein ASD24_21310 [Paenibacillus sp. Root52]